jgi:hypothetical protein
LVASCVSVLAGCPFGKKKTTEGDEAGAAASTPSASSVAAPATPAGANEKSIARYADEKPLTKDTAINFAVASITEAAGAGKTIAFLKKGTAVTQFAQHGTFVLITFKDPKDASRTLMGWVNEAVFGDEPVKAAVALTCKSGEKIFHVPKATGLEDQCHRGCNPDADDCPAGLGCTGAGADKNQPGVLFFFCEKAPTPPPLVCSGGDTKMRVKFPSGVEDDDCVHVCAPVGTVLTPEESDKKCPTGSFCGGVGKVVAAGNATAGFCTKGKRAGAPAAATGAATTTPTTPAATAKVKCVLSSPPPCAPPHAVSPKGLCQVPCPTGDCSTCGGTCQKGFCVTPL